jgi:hypothetical protein
MTSFKQFLFELSEKPHSWVYKGKSDAWKKQMGAWHGTGITFKDHYDPKMGIRYTIALKNGKRMGVYHHGKHTSYAGGAVEDAGDAGSVGDGGGADGAA